jgi:hypothetical protein
MAAYFVIITATALLGLFVDESRLRSSAKQALAYAVIMSVAGWLLGWPMEAARCGMLLIPISSFISSRIIGRSFQKLGERYNYLSVTMYFSMNYGLTLSTMLKDRMGL